MGAQGEQIPFGIEGAFDIGIVIASMRRSNEHFTALGPPSDWPPQTPCHRKQHSVLTASNDAPTKA
ncbi:MAG TPA: hypothetical protein VG848_07470, partial [Acetobacteraceae bacterium]|nr:hypothetical protein [Acetobacteraceae bacterium]